MGCDRRTSNVVMLTVGEIIREYTVCDKKDVKW